MPVSGPDLISCSATIAESLAVRAVTMSESRIFIIKNHKGNPWREMEMFTVSEVQSPAGVLFFNLDPVRVEVLDQGFQLVSGINISGDLVRFYYNPGSSGTQLRHIDYNVELNQAGAAVILPFDGKDPFIMDARTADNPQRLYLMYVNTAGKNAFRISSDNGAIWGAETLIDDTTATDHARVEGNFNDPLGARENVQVLQMRFE